MGIDPAPFGANLFLYTCESECMSEHISNDKVKARHFHATKRFIDDLSTLDDGVDKRDAFRFFIVCMPYVDSNISKSIYYSALVGEFLKIARSSLLCKGFNEKATELLNTVKARGPQSTRRQV